MKNKIFVLIFGIFLIVGISGAGFNTEIINELIEAGAELIEIGILQFGEGDYDIGNLIGEELESTDISVSSVRVEKKEEISTIDFFGNDGSASIKGNLYENVDEGSSIKLDNEGNMKEAYLKVGEGGSSFIFDGQPYHIPEGGIIEYKDGEIIVKADSFEIGDKESNEFAKVNLLGESIKVKNVGENYIITGNSKIGRNEIRGLGEGNGKVTVYRGRVSEIWKDTEATINGIECSVSGENVKTSYSENFDLSKCKGNCVNFGEKSMAFGGSDFTIKLGEKNDAFGDMETKKYIIGQKEPKTRDLEITLKGGFVEIKKDPSKDYLAFDVNGNGDYVINTGRTIIWGDYSERGFIERDGKVTLSDQSKIFVKASEDKEGLLYSYDLTLNDKYVLEDNLFKDKKGNILMNTNKPWENTIKKGSLLPSNAEKLTGKAKEIYEELLKKHGARPRIYYSKFMNQETEEDLLKGVFEASEIASQNIYGHKLPPEIPYVLLMQEGAASSFAGVDFMDEHYYEDHDKTFNLANLGLDHIGTEATKQKLYGGKFLSEDFKINSIKWVNFETTADYEFSYTAEDNLYNAAILLAAEYGSRLEFFLRKYDEYHGEGASEKLSEEDKHFGGYYTFNRGEGHINYLLKNFKSLTSPYEGEDYSGNVYSPKLNAKRFVATIMLFEKLGTFSSP